MVRENETLCRGKCDVTNNKWWGKGWRVVGVGQYSPATIRSSGGYCGDCYEARKIEREKLKLYAI